MADNRYVSVWLNGMEERQARWYLKEGIPCFMSREVSSTRGDLILMDTARSFDPSWIWPVILPNDDDQEQPKEVVDYKPPPLTMVVIDTDRIPWIKPPLVQKAEQSLPGTLLIYGKHVRNLWSNTIENTFYEVSLKKVIDYGTHSMFDRERRWQILFLRSPKAPPGLCHTPQNIFPMAGP
ncbi:uncharacterized protein LACBIDRAFT_329791 [Laccaria bicolor S238N-H82]|uniref:Predicted protein n=1 Tax=Laccaria bicolor (strain S238N-H82 / ATCC MYA-4686) TaxID=486041 RepID=B0DJ90_LACBS|nr:uncharacterized protein LACBIDRAFT_329791 [Laccaria bicolor S238N-H82]EDR05480.1 predicted protein [Laccaria bicolor S238N-H82]|eukprot:XP_001884038.1 predicted protein [Laccaria bicolor S238N-H82]